jgi:hypothetical protein
MYYRGDIIYSYGGRWLPIAKLTTLNGKLVVFRTTEGCSSSTAKHCAIVDRAISHMTVLYVQNPLAETKFQHKENYKYILADRIAVLKKYPISRSNKGMYYDRAEELRHRANAYTQKFKLGFRAIIRPDRIALEETMIRLNEKESAARNRKLRSAKKRRQERLARVRRDRIKWLHGEITECPFIYGHGEPTGALVRIKNGVLETSEGANVPLEAALKLFKIMIRCNKTKVAWIPRDNQKIDQYPITVITKHGTLKVSCHTITLDVALQAAQIAGIEV